MSARWSNWVWGLLALAATTGAAWEILADRTEQAEDKAEPPVAVETLLPAETVVYARLEGTKKHAAAWQQTAAHEALTRARVDELFEKLIAFARQQAPGTFHPEVEAFATHLSEYGGSLAIAVPPGPPLPRATLVLHRAAKYEELVSEISTILAENNIESETREIENRNVHIAHLSKTPAMDLAWWTEGGHLVMAVGVDPVQNTLAIANGKKPNITEHRLWSQHEADNDRTVTSITWVDGLSLREKLGGFAIPIPDGKPILISDALEILGLHNVDELVMKAGYEGKALWSETRLNTTGKRTGLLSLPEGKAISFDDLPPLPVKTNSFLATTIKPAGAYETIRQTIRDVLSHSPNDDYARDFDRAIDYIPGILGFDMKTDILDALGDLVVVYDDPDQGFLGTGSALVVKVDDADKLRQSFEKIFANIDSLVPEDELFLVHRAKKQGREIWTFEFGQTVQSLGMAVDDDWLVIALMPQPVEAFFLRVDGKLPAWSKEQLTEQGAPLVPEKFTTIGVSNPRIIYQSLLKLAPYGMSALVGGLKGDGNLPRNAQLPWMLSDLPPAELIGGPLFPNVWTMTQEDSGLNWTSRSSLPSLPVVGGPGGGNSALAGSLVTGFMLPAYKQSREAARRSQSKNNLKQLGLAMHNYHDVHGSFPAATLPNEKLKPKERLSFFVELLPFVEQAALYEKIDKDGGWKEKDHREIMETRVPVFINPKVAAQSKDMPTEPDKQADDDNDDNDDNYAPTHYVGIAGVGKDAPLLPANSKRAGVFGYNRKTRIRDITDGTSNTVMISEASKDFGAWGAGGNATLRSLTKKPYINGPDGIGSPFQGGCQMLFGDGSVRFLSENIDPDTMKALSTMAGGEVIGDF